MESNIRQEIESAVLNRLLDHLRNQTEVQNIELMIVADFCRNCLAKWYVAEANQRDVELDYATAQEFVYGMPYSLWKSLYQTEATPEQVSAYEERQRKSAKS